MRLPAFIRAVATVLAAFIGIRARKNADHDADSFRPLHLLAAGLITVALFITILLLIVQSIV